ncbi:MAG: zonular occludens toxin domain-containing protein [Candidatus Aenigmatarchaeota archaeon]
MIIGYVGTRGKGKSLSLVREAYEHYKDDYIIYSNIGLNRAYFKDYNILDISMIKDWIKGDKQFSKAFFILDEAHLFLDSRSGMTKSNKIISYFVLQTRKRNVRIGFTTQFWHQIDKRLRDPTEIRVICNNKEINNKLYQYNIIQDFNSGYEFQDIFCSSDYFDYYDTDEIVNPFN